MRHWAVLLFCILYAAISFGQTPGRSAERLNLIYTDYTIMNSVTSLTVYYGGVFEHKENTLAADSSYTYEDENKNQFFEAFGNVVITQPSGTVIYADKLHYDALVQLAVLTGNVKMIDANSVLTTNYLTYNMRSKTGTYRTGGRLVSNGDTITSKNAYYFENTADAYFRHDVVVRSPKVKVFTDSMRYNSLSKETYFFGPTNIKGNEGENLYTELGTYNTGTGIAKFSLNNLYTEGTKFLKGDSLYYNRDFGVGEAYRNVVFVDTLDKFYAYGGKGLYRRDDESILMTEKPLIITVVKNDSTENTTPVDSTQIDVEVSKKQQRKGSKTVVEPAEESRVESVADSVALADIAYKSERDTLATANDVDSVYMTADTLFSKVILLKDYKPLQLNLSRDGGQLMEDEAPDYGDDEGLDSTGNAGFSDEINPLEKDSLRDSLRIDMDSIARHEVGNVDLLLDSLATVGLDSVKIAVDSVSNIDVRTVVDTVKTLEKEVKKPLSPPKKVMPLTIDQTLKADSVLREQAVIPTGSEADMKITEALKVAQTPDSVRNNVDLSGLDSTKAISDTAKTRIVRAHYNVRLFKSDLQAVADSVYYGMADSMFRFMGRPMIWAEDSQISADTIFMQIVHQQVDNALLKNNAFMVNAALDTAKFNQLKGRVITAFFKNNNIEKLFVDGNAENISFAVDEKAKVITEMFHDRGARIKVRMENKEIIDYTTIRNVDQKVYPFNLVTQENEILQGFIWRPQDRPTSKEDLLNRKRELDKGKELTVSDSISTDTEGRLRVQPLPSISEEDSLERPDKLDESPSENSTQGTTKNEALKEEETAVREEKEPTTEEGER